MAADKADKDVATMSRQEAAELFKCDYQTIERYNKLGLMVKVKHGRYDILGSTTRVVVYLRDQAAGRQTKDGQIDAVEESALLKRAQRELTQARVKQAMGELISIPELHDVWGGIIRAVKGMVISWPSQVAFELPHLTPHDREVMKRITENLLRQAALADHPELGPLPRSDADA